MIDRILKRLHHISGLLPLGAVFGLAAYAARLEIKDLDIWLHLATGKFILNHGTVPLHDIFSFTLQGKPWINHEWLFQSVLYGVYSNWGVTGLNVLQSGVVVATLFLLLSIGYRRDRRWMIAGLLFLVFLVFSDRFTVRPDLFSLFFLATYLAILSQHLHKKWAIPVLFLVQLLWVNSHGFFFFGPLLVLIGLVAEGVKRWVPLPYQWNEAGRLSNQEWRRLGVVFVLGLAACVLNPHGINGALYPLGVMLSLGGEDSIFFEYIQELQRPIPWAKLFDMDSFLYYRALIILSVISFGFNRRRIDISVLFFWIFFLLFSLGAMRNTPYFAFAAYLVIIINMQDIRLRDVLPVEVLNTRFAQMVEILLGLFLLLFIFHYGSYLAASSYFDYKSYGTKSEYGGVSLRSFPHEAADFLQEEKISGRFFNDFNSGAYLIGHVWPEIQVFIDGRTELYGGTYFKRYTEAWDEGDPEVFEALVAEHDITGAFLSSVRQHIPYRIVKYLYEHDDWKLVYLDYDAAIFLKDIPGNRQWIETHELDLKTWQAEQLDLYRIGPMVVNPYQYFFRAYTLETMGEPEAALREIEAGMKLNPAYASLYHLRGRIRTDMEDMEAAFEDLRIAAMMQPLDREVQYNLAIAYMNLKKYDDAIAQCLRIIRQWPQTSKGYFYLARALVGHQQYKGAFAAVRKAYERDPSRYEEVFVIGDMAARKGAYEVALSLYHLLDKNSEAQVSLPRKLGYVALQQGDWKSAREWLSQALAMDPTDHRAEAYLRELDENTIQREALPSNAVEKLGH